MRFLTLRLPPAIVVSAAVAALHCGHPVATRQAAASEAKQTDAPIAQARDANDVARFLAGLPGISGSPFAELEESAAWKQHREVLDAAWKRAEGELIQGLAMFQQQELNRPQLTKAPVFYPFAGPDTITPLVCFPKSSHYVLVALEPAGTLPTQQQIRRKQLPGYMSAMRKTMASILGRSFFVTREMDRQFRGQVTDGLLVPILELLVRTGHTVLGMRYVRLDDDGRLIGRAANYHTQGVIGNKGVEIEFRSDADQSVHRLCYLSVNLSNSRLSDDPAFLNFASTLKGSSTLLKATSYMMHKPEFSSVRDLVVQNSGAVLQDDSGIPYRYFATGWRVQLYGGYQRPFGSFKWMEQKDLRAAYQRGGAKPLPMPIGYGYRRVASNMMLAERQ